VLASQRCTSGSLYGIVRYREPFEFAFRV